MKKQRMVFIINGENVPVEVHPRALLCDAADSALRQSHNDTKYKWQVRDEAGRLLDGTKSVESFDFVSSVRLFMNLPVAAGG